MESTATTTPAETALPSGHDSPLASEAPPAMASGVQPVQRKSWPSWPVRFIKQLWNAGSLFVLLAVLSAVPVLQFASLGYLLTAGANLARGGRWSTAFPGARRAGRLGVFAAATALSWLPVWLVSDLSYSAQLLQPGSAMAARWRAVACGMSLLWLAYVGWAAMRGGRLQHFFWPAPVRFFKTIWRPVTWSVAHQQLFDWVAGYRPWQLWWLGARAAAGAMLWIAVPVSLMIIGERSFNSPWAGLAGLLGAVAMTVIACYLPFLQIQMAVADRFNEIFAVGRVRRRFRYAPLAHALSLLLLCLLCLPVYLLRIEATPAELLWIPSLFFVLFMLPAKICLGAAMGFAESRRARQLEPRSWWLRQASRALSLLSGLIYVGGLYVAQLAAGQGALVMYFQHAFLVPVLA